VDVVSSNDDGRPELIQGIEQVEQPLGHFWIDVARRLVREEKLRPGDDGARDRHPLLLATRQGRRPGARAMAEPDPVHHLADRRFEVLLLDPSDTEGQGDIVESGEVPDEAEILEDNPDPPSEAGQSLARHGDDILTEQPDQPAAWTLGEIEQLQK
jgi:hypothetical protein